MISRDKVDRLEKLIGQLASVHLEIAALAKKAPNDGVNSFKLNFVNAIIANCNEFFGNEYKPLPEFEVFNADDVPSNSDVTFIISQYIGAAEKYRTDNIKTEYTRWYYELPEGETPVRTSEPKKLGK